MMLQLLQLPLAAAGRSETEPGTERRERVLDAVWKM